MRLPNLAVGCSSAQASSPWTPTVAPAHLFPPDPDSEVCSGTVCVPGGPGCLAPCTCLCSVHLLLEDEQSGTALLASSGCKCQ